MITLTLKERQIALEETYNKNQLIPRIRAEFVNCEDFNFVEYLKQSEIPEMFGIDVLVQMVLHKRASLTTLIGCLRHHFEDSQMTADMLHKAAVADLMDYDPELRMFILKFDISEDVQAQLDRFQFPLPMIVEPLHIGSNNETGYLNGKGSVILRNNHHHDDVCLDHLNRMNKLKFVINNDTATMVENKWRNLDKPKAGEKKEDFEKRKRAFDKYDHTAKDVMKLLPEEFYLTHKYDKRGRIYCQGYHVNYQGNPWNKAVVELADKELVQ